MLTDVSFAAIVQFQHTTPSIFRLRERECCGKRPNKSYKRDHIYYHSSNREKIKIICLQLVVPNIEFHLILQ